MLTVNQTISRFLQPVTVYPNIGLLQTVLVRSASPTGNVGLAATRCLSLLFDLDLRALLMSSVAPIKVLNPSVNILAGMAPVQQVVNTLTTYFSTINLALTEGKSFLPGPTVDVLQEYAGEGSPTYQTGVAIFLVLTSNLQDL